jgi:hypothetical protein
MPHVAPPANCPWPSRQSLGLTDLSSYIGVMKRTVVVRPHREAPVLVCKKCLKRSPDGAKIRRRLKRELKATGQEGASASHDRLLQICPKAAVILTDGQTLARGEYLLASPRDDAEVASVCSDDRSLRLDYLFRNRIALAEQS